MPSDWLSPCEWLAGILNSIGIKTLLICFNFWFLSVDYTSIKTLLICLFNCHTRLLQLAQKRGYILILIIEGLFRFCNVVLM